MNKLTFDSSDLKCGCIEARLEDVVEKSPILVCFRYPLGFKFFYEPETIHHKEMSESSLYVTTFYSEIERKTKVGFNGEKVTFNLTTEKKLLFALF